jgi:pimeloyl-ACP methyl ester carboxylesterase
MAGAGLTELERWRSQGSFVEVDSRRLFVVDQGPREGPAILVLHGFPSASYDFHRVLSELTRDCRLVVHDHSGFGLSEKNPGDSFSLFDQARLASGLWEQLGIRSGHLVAHDYGTSVATELLALRELGELEVGFDSLTLSNGSIYIELAQLLKTQRLLKHRLIGPIFARLTSRRFFRARMRGLWGDESKFDRNEIDALWEGLVSGGGRRVLAKIARYVDERFEHRERWVGALQRLDLPALVLWGRRDPIAVVGIAEQLMQDIPGARSIWLDEVGHYPMLEAPGAWAGAVNEFIQSVELSR